MLLIFSNTGNWDSDSVGFIGSVNSQYDLIKFIADDCNESVDDININPFNEDVMSRIVDELELSIYCDENKGQFHFIVENIENTNCNPSNSVYFIIDTDIKINTPFTKIEHVTTRAITNFNICWYDNDQSYLQFTCVPPVWSEDEDDCVDVLERIQHRFPELEIGEITSDGDNVCQVNIGRSHTLKEAREIGFPVSNES